MKSNTVRIFDDKAELQLPEGFVEIEREQADTMTVGQAFIDVINSLRIV